MTNIFPLRHIGAFALYVGLAFLFVDHGLNLTTNILGSASDPYIFIWFLSWWPWAIQHHLNPLYTPLVWQPLGVPILWVTSIPFLALLCLPFTLLDGPVLAYNMLILSAPALSAYFAYRLCWRVTQMPAAAIIGGYLFGFSSYEIAVDQATPNLSFTMFLPCLVLLALYRLSNEIGRSKAVLLTAVIMIFQFMISIEVFATLVFFGFLAWLFAIILLPPDRQRLRTLLSDVLFAALITGGALSPLLWSMIKNADYVSIPYWWPYYYSTNLLNLFIPTKITVLGGYQFLGLSKRFQANLFEQGAYLGPPLMVILFLSFKEGWYCARGRYFVTLFLTILIASLGPVLWLGGEYSKIPLPWIAFLQLPLIQSALPSRFTLYTALLTAVIAAIWIAEQGDRRFGRIAIGLFACVALVPLPHASMKIPTVPLFQPGRLQTVLGSNLRLLVLPFGVSQYWQVENRFGYTQTGGYLGYPPTEMLKYPAAQQLSDNVQTASTPANLRQFALATHTQYIVAGPGTSPGLFAALAQLHWKMQQTDDVTIYTVPGEAPPPHG